MSKRLRWEGMSGRLHPARGRHRDVPPATRSCGARAGRRALHDYRLLEQIGSGAFSIVWRGTQPSVRRDVAIKQIRAELASQPEFIRRFEAEAQWLRPLSIYLFDVDAGTRVGLLHEGAAGFAGPPALTDDGSSVWLITPDRATKVSLDADTWRDRACELAGRDLTEEEWATYVPGDEAPRPICT